MATDLNGLVNALIEQLSNYRDPFGTVTGSALTDLASSFANIYRSGTSKIQSNLLDAAKYGLMTEYDAKMVIDPHTSEDLEYGNHYVNGFGSKPIRLTDSLFRDTHDMFSRYGTGLTEKKALTNFNRFYSVYPEMEIAGNLKTYIFMTRPDFNIYSTDGKKIVSENSGDPYTAHLNSTHPEILHMLTSDFTSVHDFIPYLQSRAISLQLPDFQIDTTNFTVPMFNYKYSYPTVTNESTTGGSFEIAFREDSELRISKLFHYWIYYMDAVQKNILHTTKTHIYDNEYDFMCSVYEFVCDPTSERIIFWSKYTGCFPTSVPTSNFSFELHNSPDATIRINFQYIRTEHLTPAIISDFLKNIHSPSGNLLELIDTTYDVMAPSMAGCPTIVQKSANGISNIYLRWYEPISPNVGNFASYSNFQITQNATRTSAEMKAYAAFLQRNQTNGSISTKYAYKGDSETPLVSGPDTRYEYTGSLLNPWLTNDSNLVP